LALLPPVSTALIASAVLGITLLQMFLTKKFMNPEERKELDSEIKAYRAELQEAKRLKDKQAVKKLEKREARIRQLEGKMASASAKQMAITIGVFLLVLYGLIYRIGNYGAYISTPLLENFLTFPDTTMAGRYYIPAMWWYFVCATFFQSILGRIFGTTRR
jgi:uncharacterized membrane protein (DUF106 family)